MKQACEAVQVVMAAWCQWWLCGGYVFPAAGLNEILTLKLDLT